MTCGTSHCAHRSLGFRRWHNIGVIGAVGEQECCSEDECMAFHEVEDGSENIEMREDLIRSTNSLFFTGWVQFTIIDARSNFSAIIIRCIPDEIMISRVKSPIKKSFYFLTPEVIDV